MALLVEFFGPPGSGKTSCAEDVVALLKSRGRRVVLANRVHVRRSRRGQLLGKLVTAARHGRLVADVTAVLVDSPRAARDKWQALRLVLSILEKYDAARRDPSDTIHVFDEGTVQRAFLLFVERRGPSGDARTSAYAGKVPLADVLVQVEADPEVLMARLQARYRGLPPRFAGLDVEDVSQVLLAGAVLLREVAELAAHTDARPERVRMIEHGRAEAVADRIDHARASRASP